MPLKSALHQNKLLGNVSVKYKNPGYVAKEVFPAVPVVNDSDLYRIYARNFRLPNTLRSNKGEANVHGFDVSTAGYYLEQHSLKDFVSDRDAENYDLASLMADTTEELTDKILLRLEKSVADLMTSTSWSLGHSLSTAQQWSLDSITSNPILQMDTATSVIIANSGMKPNYAVIPYAQMIHAKNHTSVIDRIKYTSADITPAMLAGLFDLPQILVPTTQIDSAAEGVADSIGPVFSDNVFVGYKPANPGPLQPSAGYIFMNSIPMVKSWRVEERQSQCVEVNIHYQAKVVASLSGYLLKDVSA